ncbi:unnamed protein product [Durusdinium trenchii]|uniref:Protein kinase domain-containing protein n=1 Tax=Durusdinium trenchii TaxID=1381693 RepID=A0ABP0NII7_9DINO
MSREPGRRFQRLCVYGGSSSKVSEEYLRLASTLGETLAKRKIGLVFGGGKVGLMGAVADAVLAHEGEVIGVIPRDMVELEQAHQGCTSLRVVDTMHERKALMASLADGFIALPGGWGTLDEIAEVTTWTQLNIHLKPVGLLNRAGYWDHLLLWAEKACQEGFMTATSAKMLLASDDPEALLELLATAELPAEFRWQPPVLPKEPLPLQEGQLVTVGQRPLRVGLAIGEGAYARVFGAVCEETGQEVAIKEMRCGQGAGILPDASLQRANYEVKVMRLLSEPSEEGEALRVPKFLDHQFWDLAPAEPGAFLCRVAMTRRPGQALISWLEERSVCSSPAASTTSYCSDFLRAALSARELLSQLAPTFAQLNSIAMHRDVNARNILVFCPNSALEGGHAAPKDTSSLEFTLLDFGSSLDFHTWSATTGEGSWSVENPTGDARYWGPASWVRFLHGPHAMSDGLQQQYSQGLDAFALGICTLEVLSKLHGSFSLPKEAGEDPQIELMESINQFQKAWSRYWSFAILCFEKLAEYSQMVCFNEQQRATQLWEDTLWLCSAPPHRVRALRVARLRECRLRIREVVGLREGSQVLRNLACSILFRPARRGRPTAM